jgi:hypothetical protein
MADEQLQGKVQEVRGLLRKVLAWSGQAGGTLAYGRAGDRAADNGGMQQGGAGPLAADAILDSCGAAQETALQGEGHAEGRGSLAWDARVFAAVAIIIEELMTDMVAAPA